MQQEMVVGAVVCMTIVVIVFVAVFVIRQRCRVRQRDAGTCANFLLSLVINFNEQQ